MEAGSIQCPWLHKGAHYEDTSGWPPEISEVKPPGSEVLFQLPCEVYCGQDVKQRVAKEVAKGRILALRRRCFCNRSFKLWAEDFPDRCAIFIHACDEVTGHSGHLEIFDERLRQAYGHFARCRSGGMAADLDLDTNCKTVEDSQKRLDAAYGSCNDPLNEAAVTHDLVVSLLDAVQFEVNAFGDEWFIHLPGFEPKSRSEAVGHDMGPAIQMAPLPGSAPAANLHARTGKGGAGRPPPRRHWPSPANRLFAGGFPRQPISERLRKNGSRALAGRLRAIFQDFSQEPVAEEFQEETWHSRSQGCHRTRQSSARPLTERLAATLEQSAAFQLAFEHDRERPASPSPPLPGAYV
eukprot:TRINITY_DN3816_c0_g1_i3.p1 TRINITY_DN3816_c0_g1~~TRINITY_DN3816_c0_g1_i3.p1  ORF type:complete len:362 (-),score=64.13 TRINITY_DN3816_c0_g1_i3:1349-2404(-)